VAALIVAQVFLPLAAKPFDAQLHDVAGLQSNRRGEAYADARRVSVLIKFPGSSTRNCLT
jgi:hypothetical protein